MHAGRVNMSKCWRRDRFLSRGVVPRPITRVGWLQIVRIFLMRLIKFPQRYIRYLRYLRVDCVFMLLTQHVTSKSDNMDPMKINVLIFCFLLDENEII